MKTPSESNKNKLIITRKTNISNLLEIDPSLSEMLGEIGLGCAGCFLAKEESIEDGAMAHGIPDEEINHLVKVLNEEIKNRFKR